MYANLKTNFQKTWRKT